MEGNGQLRMESAPHRLRQVWGYAQERPNAFVESAVRVLAREGVSLKELSPSPHAAADRWGRALADCVASGDCQGGVIFCHDPGLVCCVANKVAGLRAVPVVTVMQAGRALLSVGPNLVAVEMPGRTYFEIRQILRLVCAQSGGCPDGVACTLRELDGHAHR